MAGPTQTKSAGGFVVNQKGEILLVQEYGFYWGLPRGHIRAKESVLDAARREIKEEAGIDKLKYCRELGSYSRSTFDESGKPNYQEIKHMTFFYFTTTQTNIKIQDAAITDAGWFSFKEARKKLINADDIAFFDESIRKIVDKL